jgi:hypothetical protein
MDGQRFDDLARIFAQSATRRSLCSGSLATTLCWIVAKNDAHQPRTRALPRGLSAMTKHLVVQIKVSSAAAGFVAVSKRLFAATDTAHLFKILQRVDRATTTAGRNSAATKLADNRSPRTIADPAGSFVCHALNAPKLMAMNFVN